MTDILTEHSNLTLEDFQKIRTRSALLKALEEKDIHNGRRAKREVFYRQELANLQIEFVKLQKWIQKNDKRVAVLFEGRDASGKGGSIRRFAEHLNPRAMRIVALNKPTEVEKGQWYFRRYIKELPNAGEIVFFDRSWYNRAVVEPVMGFCNKEQYNIFMVQVPEFEHMLREDGVDIIKFWFSITKEEQQRRFTARLDNPLKRWKYSPVDKKGQELWDTYTYYKDQMFSRTHTAYCPWTIVRTNIKKEARLESMRHVLSQFDYDGKDEAATTLFPDPNVIIRYHRSAQQMDI